MLNIFEKITLQKILLTTIYIIYLLVIPLYSLGNNGKNIVNTSDFLAFYSVGKLVRNETVTNIYSRDKLESIQSEYRTGYKLFLNIPIVAFIFEPLSFLTLVQAFVIFEILNFLVLLFCIHLLEKFQNISDLQKIIIFTFPITLMAITLGQLSFLLLLITTLSYYYQKKGNYFASGIFIGLVILKHQFVFLIALMFLISKKRWHYLAGALLSTSALIFSSLLIGGQQILSIYLDLLKSFPQEFTKSLYAQGISFTSLVNFLPQNILFVFAVIAYLSICVFLYKSSSKNNYENLFLIALLASCILSPYALVYDAIIFLPFLLKVTTSKDLYNNWRFYVFYFGLFIFQLFMVSWASFLFLAFITIELIAL